jgi:hypothetical protein
MQGVTDASGIGKKKPNLAAIFGPAYSKVGGGMSGVDAIRMVAADLVEF